jgi:hypothetical protein
MRPIGDLVTSIHPTRTTRRKGGHDNQRGATVDREQHVRPISTVVTNNCDTGFDMTGSTTGKSTANAVIAQGCHENWVVGFGTEKLGAADSIEIGSPEAAIYRATQYDPSLIEAFFGMSEPDPATQDEASSFPLPFGVTACGELAARSSARS